MPVAFAVFRLACAMQHTHIVMRRLLCVMMRTRKMMGGQQDPSPFGETGKICFRRSLLTPKTNCYHIIEVGLHHEEAFPPCARRRASHRSELTVRLLIRASSGERGCLECSVLTFCERSSQSACVFVELVAAASRVHLSVHFRPSFS